MEAAGVAEGRSDPALACFVLLSRFLGVPADPKQILHDRLSAYDSNGDGILDRHDARFAEFKIWQDANGDGVSQADELKTLAEAEIASVALAGTPNSDGTPDSASVTLLATTHFTRTDGSTGLAGTWRCAGPAAPLPCSRPGKSARTTSLAIDREGDGVIDPASELIAGGAPLAAYDSNGDGSISALDERYFDLRLWQDRNENGRAELDELASLDQAGLASFEVDAPFLLALEAPDPAPPRRQASLHHRPILGRPRPPCRTARRILRTIQPARRTFATPACSTAWSGTGSTFWVLAGRSFTPPRKALRARTRSTTGSR